MPPAIPLSISVEAPSAAVEPWPPAPSTRSLPTSRSNSPTSSESGGCTSSGLALSISSTTGNSGSVTPRCASGSIKNIHEEGSPNSAATSRSSASSSSKESPPFLVITRREAIFCLLPLATALSLLLLASAVRHGTTSTTFSSPDDAVRGLRGATGLRQLLTAPYDYHDDVAAALSPPPHSNDENDRVAGRDDAAAAFSAKIVLGTAMPEASASWGESVKSEEPNDSASGRSTGGLGTSARGQKLGDVASRSSYEEASTNATPSSSEPDGGNAGKDVIDQQPGGPAIATADCNDTSTATKATTTSDNGDALSDVGGAGSGGRECRRRSRTGHCVAELFGLYDDAYRSLWPSRVDLVIRSHVSSSFFLLEMLFDSIDQMWPRGIGDVILILDDDERLAEDLIPTWIKVYYEHNSLKLPGKILQQWSYLWADNYTTAPFVALIDDDVIFNMKVTPGLLFNLTDGKPYVIGSAQRQLDHWLPSTKFFVGEDKYFANFMVQLPFLMPTSVLPRFRIHVASLHKDKGGSFDSAFKWFSKHGPKFERTQIAHTTIGNYMWAYAHDEVHWALEWTNHTPIPRVGVHLPYTQPFRVATKHNDNAPRVIKTYVQVAAYYSHEGVCHALPAGELPGCDDVNPFSQRQIWQYAMDWYDWPAIKEKKANATIVYDQYRNELACMYWKVAQAGGLEWTTVQLRGANPAGSRKQLLTSLQGCITPRS